MENIVGILIQEAMLKKAYKELSDVGVPITGIYMPTEDTDAGLEINGKFVLHIAPYEEPGLFLDDIKHPGESIASFSTINTLIQFMMEDS